MTQLQDVRFTQPPWRFAGGAAVVMAAFAGYAALSLAHIQIVTHTVGMDVYLGEGDRLPPDVLIAGQLNKAVALIGALWLVGLRMKGAGWEAVGLRPAPARWIWLGALAGLGFFASGLFLLKALVGLTPGWAAMTKPPFTFGGDTGLIVTSLYFAATFAVTPFAEEVFFRGFMFRWMSGRYPVIVAALVSSVLFGASHIMPPQAINAFVMALALCWLYRRTGSIWPAVAAHSVNNVIGVMLGAAAAAGGLPSFLTPPA